MTAVKLRDAYSRDVQYAGADKLRAAAAALVSALERLLAELSAATEDRDWLRPLAILAAEIECGVLRQSTFEASDLAAAHREAIGLLCGCDGAAVGFALRYLAARRTSPALDRLHDQAVGACLENDTLAEGYEALASERPDTRPCCFGAGFAARGGIAATQARR